MAKIRGKEFFDIQDSINQAKEYLEVSAKIQKQLQKNAQEIKQFTKGNQVKTAKDFRKLSTTLQQSSRNLKSYNKEVKNSQKLQEQLKKSTDAEVKGRLRLQKIQQEQRKILKDEIELENKQIGTLKKLQIENRKLRRERDGLNLETQEGTKRLQEINAQLDKNNQRISESSDKFKKSKLNVGNYEESIRKAGAGLRNFAMALGVVGGVQALSRVMRDAFNIVKNFDQAQANLASVLGVSRDSMASLTKQAKELGATTKFTASQVSELQLEFAKLGFTQKEIEDVTEATLQLAAAAGTDLGNAAAIAGATIRGFGLDTSETQRVVDVMAKSFSSSSLDIEKFKTAMAAVAPVAKSAGLSIERTTALLGTLTDRGIDASTAGTGLRNVFLALTQKGLTFEQAMTQINSASDKSGKSLELFGKRGATLGVILAENGASVDNLEGKLKSAGGAAKEMADKQLDTLGGKLDLLRSAWEGYILGADGASGASEKLKEIVAALADNLPMVLNTVLSLVGAFVGFKILKTTMSLFKGLSFATKGATFSMKGLNTAMRANPLGIIITVVELAITAFFMFRKEIMAQIDPILEMFESWEKFQEGLIAIVDIMMGGLLTAMEAATTQTKELTAEQERNNKVNSKALEQGKEILKQSQEEISQMQIMLTALTDETTTREERNKIIDELNKKYPELLKNIDLETAGSEELLAVQKAITANILEQAIERQKAAVIEQFTNAIIQKEIDILMASTEESRKVLEKQRDELVNSLPLIEEITQRVSDNVMNVVDGMSDAGDQLTEITDQMRILRDELDRIESDGIDDKDQAKRISEINKQLDDLEARRKRLLGFGLEGAPDEDAEGSGSGSAKEDKRNKEIENLRRKHELELIKIENEGIQAGKDAELIRQDQLNRRREQILEELELIKKLYGEGSDEVLDAEIRLQNEWLTAQREFEIERVDIRRKKNDEIVKEQKSMYDILNEELQKHLEEQRKAREKAIEEIKKGVKEQIEIIQDLIDKRQEALDQQIESREDEIDVHQDRISQLKELAAEGNLSAEESIKAEEQRVANLEGEIRDLEKRKQRLLVLNLALQTSLNLAEAGDPNAISKGFSQVGDATESLPTFKEGTEDTGQGGKVDNYGGFAAILHPHERVLPEDLNTGLVSRGLSNEEVATFAMRYHDQMNMHSMDNASFGNYELLSKLNGLMEEQRKGNDILKTLPDSMPTNRLDWDPIRKAVVEEVSKGNKKNRYIRPI